jgi:hypothetical protein
MDRQSRLAFELRSVESDTQLAWHGTHHFLNVVNDIT